MIRLTFPAAILALLIFSVGCSKESNIVAPSGSTIEVTALPSETVTAGGTVNLSATVKDSNGHEMNGVGVTFKSSNANVASFSSTAALSQKTVDTNDQGVATVTVYTFTGKTGSADITADIERASGSVSLTVE